MTKYIFSLFTILAFLSCEDRRTLDFDDQEKQVVLNSILSPDSLWHVDLSYTKSLFDDSNFDFINDATVKVENLTNGQSFFLDLKSEGRYARNLNPVEGHEYNVTVDIEGQNKVMATSYIPALIDAEVISQITTTASGQQSLEIDISIIDDPTKEDYYVWEIKPIENSNYSVLTPIESPQDEDVLSFPEDLLNKPDESTVPLVPNPGRQEISSKNIFSLVTEGLETTESNNKSFNSLSFLSDKEVKEGRISNRIIVSNAFLNQEGEDSVVIGNDDENTDDQSTAKFQITVRAVSKDLFEYLKSYESYKKSDIKNTSFSRTPILYSNVENGLGIFGGYNLKTFNIIY